MAKMPDYIPKGDPDRKIWFANFINKLPSHADKFGITPAERDAVLLDERTTDFLLTAVDVFKAELKERVDYKNQLMDGRIGTPAPTLPTVTPPVPPPVLAAPGIIARARALANRIKAHPRYTQADGRDLRIIAPGEPGGTVIKPTATVAAKIGSVVEIKWVKNGYPAVLIEGKRGSEASWSLVATSIKSPWNDTRAPLVANVPEVRQYRLRYVKDDVPVGEASDVLAVSTTP